MPQQAQAPQQVEIEPSETLYLTGSPLVDFFTEYNPSTILTLDNAKEVNVFLSDIPDEIDAADLLSKPDRRSLKQDSGGNVFESWDTYVSSLPTRKKAAVTRSLRKLMRRVRSELNPNAKYWEPYVNVDLKIGHLRDRSLIKVLEPDMFRYVTRGEVFAALAFTSDFDALVTPQSNPAE